MKRTRKPFALLLALLLALGLAAPAMAASAAQAVNWGAFRIIEEPQSQTIPNGESFTLSVEVNIPDGVEVEYQWYWTEPRTVFNMSGYKFTSPIPNATAPEVQLKPGDAEYPVISYTYNPGERFGEYYCQISAYEKDGSGAVVARRDLESETVRVDVLRSAGEKVYGVTLEPFAIAFMQTVLLNVWTFLMALPFSPIIFLYYLAGAFVIGFRGLS